MRTPALASLPLAALALAAAACSSSPATPPPAPMREVGAAGGPVRVVPHGAEPFDPAKESAVWCATFPMAWEALGRDVLRGAPDLGPPAPAAFVAGMNARPLPAGIVDDASSLALAGRIEDGILDRIAAEGRRRFGRDLPGIALPPLAPGDFLAYACLFKDLPFEHPFETIEGGVPFPGGTGNVAAWGVAPGRTAEAAAPLLTQVRLLHRTPANEPDAFVLELRPRGGGDRILLARVPPAPTLGGAWDGAARLVAAGGPRALSPDATLRVPRIGFRLLRRFGEIVDAPFRNPGFDGYRVAAAIQSVEFRLDEAGASLESEAAVAAWLSEPLARPDHFVFDGPFLVALLREGAAEPYFLAWVAGRELLAP